MLPWMAVFTIGIDVQWVTVHRFTIPSTFYPNRKLMKLGNESILHASTLYDNTRSLYLTKQWTNVKPHMKRQMAKSRKQQWITLTTLALWCSFVVMTSPSSSLTSILLANNRNIAWRLLNISFHLSCLSAMLLYSMTLGVYWHAC